MSTDVPTLEEVVEGTYSRSRYAGRLDDFWLRIRAVHLRAGKPQTDACAISLAGRQAVREGHGFPESLSEVEVIGVSGAKEGVSLYPELHFAATLNRTGARILCKAVSRDFQALEVVSCNDLGTAADLAARVAASSRPVELRFTDTRYTLARRGNDLPANPEASFVRQLSNNAVRRSATSDEAVAMVYELARDYAAAQGMPAEAVPRLAERAARVAAVRAPGLRDRNGEAPRRVPARRRSTLTRWTGEHGR